MSASISKNSSTPDGPFIFWFERDHDVMPSTRWLLNYGTPVSIGLSILYLIAIYSGQYAMRKYQRKEMKLVLILWNLSSAVFATMGSIRMIPELTSSLYYKGFRDSLCNADFPFREPTGFWTEMFMWSKAVELIDTAFLVLRKRPIIFLHWYHHVTVMMYTWHASREHTASGRWFVTMNFTVHAMMYTYYALRIMGFNRLPKFIPMTLTALQLSQMVVGCYISASVFWLKNSGYDCHQTIPYACRKLTENKTFMSGIKKQLNTGVYPAEASDKVLETIQPLFSLKLIKLANVIEAGFCNMNMIVHPPPVVFNAGWIEATKGNFSFYTDGCSPAVCKMMDAIDGERMEIAKALGLKTEPFITIDKGWYGDTGKDNTYEHIHFGAFHGFFPGPPNLANRYIAEDMNFILVPIVRLLAARYKIATPVCDAMFLCCEVLTGQKLAPKRNFDHVVKDGESIEQMHQRLNKWM